MSKERVIVEAVLVGRDGRNGVVEEREFIQRRVLGGGGRGHLRLPIGRQRKQMQARTNNCCGAHARAGVKQRGDSVLVVVDVEGGCLRGVGENVLERMMTTSGPPGLSRDSRLSPVRELVRVVLDNPRPKLNRTW